MKKLFITLCGVVVLSGLSHFAYAEGQDCHRKFTPEMKAKMEQKRAEFEKRLNLTPEQKEKMKAIHQGSKDRIRPLFESMKAEKAKLRELKEAGASPQEIQAQEQKVQQIKEQLRAIRKSNFEQIQSILTPEQQKEFNKMHEEHKKLREQRNNSKQNQQ